MIKALDSRGHINVRSPSTLFHENCAAKVLNLIGLVTHYKVGPFYSCFWLLLQTASISTTFVGRADSISIPTTLVGTAMLTKFVGMVYFDKSCIKHRYYFSFTGGSVIPAYLLRR